MLQSPRFMKLGIAWIVLCFSIALHVMDEALTGFLSVYNPTVTTMRERWGWFPMPTFTFRVWLFGLIAGIMVALFLSPFVFRGARFVRPIAWLLSVLMILNAGGHTLATILGHTVEGVRFPRPAPGFYSSPIMFLAALCLISQLRQTASPSSEEKARSVSA